MQSRKVGGMLKEGGKIGSADESRNNRIIGVILSQWETFLIFRGSLGDYQSCLCNVRQAGIVESRQKL
jgi:hypothetical protein